MTPLFLYFLFWGGEHGAVVALAIFLTAGMTDIIDGRLARRLQVESVTGKMLDPLADKVLVLSAFVSFVFLDLVQAWMVVLIILRDVLVTAIRFLLETRHMPMSTSNLAKGKTAVQITLIILILSYLSLKSYQALPVTDFIEGLHLILILMFVTVLITLYTGVDYYVVNRRSIHALTRFHSDQ
jgi:CDP-diacylglycerol--glycerol-3-phosphate 3-phosphatidyltransferase